MKVCGHCKEDKEEVEFNFKDKTKGTRNTICKSCMKISRQADYQNKKERYLERINGNKVKNREWFVEYKKTLECIKCGENHPACIDFHHRDPNEKEGTVSSLAGQTYSIERTKKEIAKCDVLCANCHRKLHWDERMAS